MKICFLYIFSNNQWAKIDLIFLFDYNDIRAFQVFKWTARCIFKCEKTKIKVVKTHMAHIQCQNLLKKLINLFNKINQFFLINKTSLSFMVR